MQNAPAANEEAPPAAAGASPSPSSPAPAASPPPPSKSTSKSRSLDPDQTFPQQLMDVLDSESTEGTSFVDGGKRVFEWTRDGTAFVIRDKAKLEKEVLPRHFTARCKYMSFVRKLYRWGFRQVEKQSSPALTFRHDHFVRGDKQRCLYMRSVVKRSGGTQNSAETPAFTGTGLAANDAALRAMYAGGGPANGGDFLRMEGMPSMYGQYPRPAVFPPLDGGGMGMMGTNLRMMEMEREWMMMNGHFQGGGMGGMPGQFPGSMSGQRPRAISGSVSGGPFVPASSTGSGGSMTSSELIEAGLRLRRMERAYGGGGGLGSGGNLSPGDGVPRTIGTSAMNEDPVDLASEMMRRDPGMEPRRALELARSFQNRAA
ncbi:hypothetical protein ACHAXT_010526 [Thalassiosira profunda]